MNRRPSRHKRATTHYRKAFATAIIWGYGESKGQVPSKGPCRPGRSFWLRWGEEKLMQRLMTTGALVVLLVALLATGALAKNIRGTNGPDVLHGTKKGDTIRALKGADKVFGRGKADVLRANRGADFVHGGNGADRIYGGLGRDHLYGDAGNDHIFAKDGTKDFVYCGPGHDRAVVDAKDKVKRCEVVNGKEHNPPSAPRPPEDSDRDEDGVPNDEDNCPGVANADQEDNDNDNKGNACDGDIDGDGVPNGPDPAPYDPSEPEKDGDGVNNNTDNCIDVKNAVQADFDKDGKGDACDADIDGGGVPNDKDPEDHNPNVPAPEPPPM